MASGPLVGGGAGGVGGTGGGNGSREKHRWAESKVYTRKSQKSSSKTNPSSHQTPSQPQQQPQPQQLKGNNTSHQTLATTTIEAVNSSFEHPPPLARPSHLNSTASDDDASSLNNEGGNTHHSHYNGGRPPLVSTNLTNGGQQCVTINLSSGTREKVRELRHMLTEELEKVRALSRKLEARELQLAVAAGPAPVTPGYSHSQLSATGVLSIAPVRKAAAVPELMSEGPFRRQLSVSVATGQIESYSMSDATEKEKRTPKANQYYRNSDFLLAKDKFPPPVSNKKSKANGGKKQIAGQGDYVSPELGKLYAHAFKSCGVLLSKLMKHKHGWVFNTPVDVKALGLHDYFTIIKHPMDLGTVKSRLSTNWYKSPREFAEDVRLTFQNAMTYNPKGQDVHVMAEQLSSLFEERWPAIEAEFTRPVCPVMSKKTPPPPLDMRRILERSDSTTHPLLPDSTPKPLSYTPHSGRTPALKKPKAKDPHKREMTYDEKQKLSNNLQNLPSEKLDIVVQMIKKRNLSLSQHDDEIEVDIDSVDTETLWELDRFVTNYKKSLSKHKRKAELAMQARLANQQNIQGRNQEPVIEKPIEDKSEKQLVASSSPIGEEKKGDNESGSSSSSSSSSDSGSSSSDSDSESSSG